MQKGEHQMKRYDLKVQNHNKRNTKPQHLERWLRFRRHPEHNVVGPVGEHGTAILIKGLRYNYQFCGRWIKIGLDGFCLCEEVSCEISQVIS